MLNLSGVTKQIGGLCAVGGVDLTVGEGEIVGLVGPNGAGKTTLLNIISGITPPTSGKVTFCGEDITALKADRICRKGIAKTFQIAESFPNLSARECVMIGVLFGNSHAPGMKEASVEAAGILGYVGLPEEKIDTLNRNLNVVELKRVQACPGSRLKTPPPPPGRAHYGAEPPGERRSGGPDKKDPGQGDIHPDHRAYHERHHGGIRPDCRAGPR